MNTAFPELGENMKSYMLRDAVIGTLGANKTLGLLSKTDKEIFECPDIEFYLSTLEHFKPQRVFTYGNDGFELAFLLAFAGNLECHDELQRIVAVYTALTEQTAKKAIKAFERYRASPTTSFKIVPN